MSRDWWQRNVLCAENLWFQIDEWAQEIEQLADNPEVKSSESAKMLLFGRREMLNWLTDYLQEHEEEMKNLLELWGLNASKIRELQEG